MLKGSVANNWWDGEARIEHVSGLLEGLGLTRPYLEYPSFIAMDVRVLCGALRRAKGVSCFEL